MENTGAEREDPQPQLTAYVKPLTTLSTNEQQPGPGDNLLKTLNDLESAPNSLTERPYPKYVFFIIGNEFCERFSFYGLRAILVLYFRNVLGFNETSSTVSYHLFLTLCYFTPIIGAILADSVWGKYNTILYLSIVYLIGELLLVISSILYNNHFFSVGLTILSLILIGGGTGGIKPCVSALSGDQFLPNEHRRILHFFSMFYFSINAGSLLSTFLTPVLRNDIHCWNRSDCFPLAFGVPCILMSVGLILFVAAKSKYTITPLPKDNVLVSFVRCIYYALSVKCNRGKRHIDQPNRGSSDASTVTVDTLSPASHNDYSNNSDQISVQKATPAKNHWIYYAQDKYDKITLNEFRSVLGVLALFLPLPVFWCLFDQQSSRWTLQATRMDGHFLGMNLKPDQIQVANPLLLLAMIPIFDIFIYPMFNKCGILKTPLQRMTAGGVLAGLTFFTSALIEQRIEYYKPSTVIPLGQGHITITNGMSNCDIAYPKFFPKPKDALSNNTTTRKQLDIVSYIRSAATSDGYDGAIERSHSQPEDQLTLENLSPLRSKSIGLVHDNIVYDLVFNSQTPNNVTGEYPIGSQSSVGCPLDNTTQYQVSLPSIESGQSKLLYIYQILGEVRHKAFNDDISIPVAGSAKVKIIMDILGNGQGMDLISIKATGDNSSMGEQSFVYQTIDDNLLSTEYLEVDAQNTNDFTLLFPSGTNQAPIRVQPIEPGSRNLIVVHEYEPKKFTVKLEPLQDNKYMISVLWQLIPYIGISAGELMFSITGLEFSYSAAPKSMKSIIFGAWYLTTAFGNLLTVAVESLHIFDNIAAEYNFYGVLMLLDMIVFAIIAYYFDSSISTDNAKKASEKHSESNSSFTNKAKPLPMKAIGLNMNSQKPASTVHDGNNNATKLDISDGISKDFTTSKLEQNVYKEISLSNPLKENKENRGKVDGSGSSGSGSSSSTPSLIEKSKLNSGVPEFSNELENYGKAVDESPHVN